MHIHHAEQWQHSHDFAIDHSHAEKTTKVVLLLTAITMLAEIVAGTIFGSMALLADGWHMATHVAAFVITTFAYQYARNHAKNPQFTFGTGKVGVLGGFSSAIFLAVVALIMIIESVTRFFEPQQIHFNEAIFVAIIGLVVNLVSAFLLHDEHPDHHPHGAPDHHHPHDHNLQAAYLHVLADALTSVLAIFALLTGKYLGWLWLDPMMGIVGAFVITQWAYGLIQKTSAILLDSAVDKPLKLDIIQAIESDADNQVCDLHIWHVSPHHLAVTIAIVTHYPQSPDYYKNLLRHISALAHIMVEVNRCPGEACGENINRPTVFTSPPN